MENRIQQFHGLLTPDMKPLTRALVRSAIKSVVLERATVKCEGRYKHPSLLMTLDEQIAQAQRYVDDGRVMIERQRAIVACFGWASEAGFSTRLSGRSRY